MGFSSQGAAYSKVYFRSYIDIPSIKGHSTSAAGPSKPFCDGAKCSFCISNLNNRNRSCHAFNPGYTFSFAIQLDFEMFVSYKVGACSRNESSTCLDSMWKNYTIPPGGKRYLYLPQNPVFKRRKKNDEVVIRERYWTKGSHDTIL